MTQKELNILLDKHEEWFQDNLQGKRLELKDEDLREMNLSGRRLNDSILENINFSESNFENAKMYRVKIRNVDFTGANLLKVEMDDSDLEDVNFANTKMEEAELMGFINAQRINFENATLDKASFIKSSIQFGNFYNASLVEANFTKSEMWDCDFRNADCSKVIFRLATLYRCAVEEATIKQADFSDARDLPEEWKRAIGWYSEEQQVIRRIKQHLKEERLR